jgi:hypothetical protein
LGVGLTTPSRQHFLLRNHGGYQDPNTDDSSASKEEAIFILDFIFISPMAVVKMHIKENSHMTAMSSLYRLKKKIHLTKKNHVLFRGYITRTKSVWTTRSTEFLDFAHRPVF